MKKSFLIFMLFFFGVSIYAIKKIAYVTDSGQETYVNDVRILPMLMLDTNFVVVEISSTVSTQDLSSYDLIIISEPSGLSGSDALVPVLKGYNKPMLNMKVSSYKKNVWGWVPENGSIIDNSTATNVVVNKPNHPVFTGMSLIQGSEIRILTNVSGTTLKGLNGVSGYTILLGMVDTLATIRDASTGQLCITEIPVGSNMNGTVILQKYLQIGISASSYANVTDDGLKIIRNAAYYLSGMEIPNRVENTVISSNPLRFSSDKIEVQSDETLNLKIHDLSGRLLRQSSGNSISKMDLSQGIFILTVSKNMQIQQRIKFIL